MAEEVVSVPEVRPGMIGLKNKKSGKVSYHFPVDVRDILRTSAKDFELADDGSSEAARINMESLKELNSMGTVEVTGIQAPEILAGTTQEPEGSSGQDSGAKTSEPDADKKENSKPASKAENKDDSSAKK